MAVSVDEALALADDGSATRLTHAPVEPPGNGVNIGDFLP
jgi:hypothetical protein